MKYKKQCEMCSGKLGLKVRFRNRWNGIWFEHYRYCDEICEQAHQELLLWMSQQTRWQVFLGRA